MRKVCIILFLIIFPLFTFAQNVTTQITALYEEEPSQVNVPSNTQQNSNECGKAGGKIIKIKECDNSESDWCVISDKEQCYADQVKNGKCTVGEYSEEFKGIVGITPRVLCDKYQ